MRFKKTLGFFFLIGILLSCGKSPSIHSVQTVTEYPDNRSPYHSLRIYQIMVEAFIDGDSLRDYCSGYGPSHHKGDLKGVIQALPYIKNLGMNAIWLTPVFDSEKGTPRYNPDLPADPQLDATGYFPRNYFKIDPHFGSLEDARELVNQAHQLGLYVFFDGVFGHNKGQVPPSPSGRVPVGPADHQAFPESTPFYTEVALYWIDKLGIDGWRLDQAYQVPVSEWHKIRQAVENKCNERKKQGLQWGTLGYMVGEVFDLAPVISESAYGHDSLPGLLSAFDFPVRYNLVQVLAVEEKGLGHQPASVLRQGMMGHSQYPSFAVPNLMLGNHDLVRFGDLIQRAGLATPQDEEYWRRHKMAFAFMASYSGPITIYYNEEIGAELPGFAAQIKDPKKKCWEFGLCDDHVSRTSGKIEHLSKREQDLYDYVSKLMHLRDSYPVLYKGKTVNLIADKEIYMDMKTWEGDTLFFILNASSYKQLVQFPESLCSIRDYYDLIGTRKISVKRAHNIIPIKPLSARLLIQRTHIVN